MFVAQVPGYEGQVAAEPPPRRLKRDVVRARSSPNRAAGKGRNTVCRRAPIEIEWRSGMETKAARGDAHTCVCVKRTLSRATKRRGQSPTRSEGRPRMRRASAWIRGR